MSQITIAEFRRLADVELCARGLHKQKLPGSLTPVYAAEATGEVVRYFGPHSMRRPWGCVMLGVFGVEVPALAEWLVAHCPQSEASGLGYYMTNEEQFMSPVAVIDEADLPELGQWFDAIYSRVISLPGDIEGLAALADEQASHLRLLQNSGPSFWVNFQDWQNQGNAQSC